MAKACLWLGLLALHPASQLCAEVAQPDLGAKAVSAFQETCLNTRGQGEGAAIAAIIARPSTQERPSLPLYGSNKLIRLFADGHFEYLVRPGKAGRYGCFVAVKGDADVADAAKAALDALPYLQTKMIKQRKKVVHGWTVTGSRNEVRLVPSSDLGSILINLEIN